jgi:hypothetical protein
MRAFYAYVYADPRDGLPFYVGKGQGHRARKHLHQATNRGMAQRLADLQDAEQEPQIAVYSCDSEAHALELERVLIEAYGRLIDGSGTLVNVLEGGTNSAGFAGRRHTAESKERIRAAMKARVMTPEHKEKIRAKAKLRTFPPLARERAAEWSRTPAGREQRAKQARDMGPAHQARMVEAARETFRRRRAENAATDN